MNNEKILKLAEGLNDAQKKAVLNPIESCTKIVAGAGTGKTKIISKRFSKLVFDMISQNVSNPANHILVITFTDKAANEMKGRIVQELEENNVKISNSQDLWISTFHSFCIRILKKYSIEANLSPSFKIGEEQELEKIYKNLIKQIKYGEVHTMDYAEKLLENLGVGIEILSIENLTKLSKINDLDSIFDDIWNIIKKIKSLGQTAPEFMFNSLLAVTDFSAKTISTPFKFETKEDYADAWNKHYKEYKDDSTPLDTDVFDNIAKAKLILDKFGKRRAIEYGAAQGFPLDIPKAEEIESLMVKVIAAIYALYQAELEKNDLVDFDDLINKSIYIFKENESIRSYYQEYFEQIIVDEFQDTNGAQLELIELLMNPKHPNITFVGDRKQSIYAFRHAQMENLDVLQEKAEKKYSQNFEPINLSINYRSTPEVLHAVNYVTTNELHLVDEELNANPTIEFPDTSKDIKVTVINDFENSHDLKLKEAEYISQEIEQLIKRDEAKFKDFAILVKSHAQADLVEKELKKRNIPSIKKVNTGFFEHSTVKNIFATLRLVKNSEDEQALFRLLKIKMSDFELFDIKTKLDKTLLESLTFDEIKPLNLVQKYKLARSMNYDGIPLIDEILETVLFIRKNQSSLTLVQIFEKIKKEITLFSTKPNEIEQNTLESINNISVFEKIIDDYTQNENRLNITSLIDYLDKIKNDKNFELPIVNTEDIDAVQILTIHASKGLEFPYVFVLSIASSSKNADKSALYFDMQYGNKPGFGIVANKFNGKSTPKSLIYKELWQKPRAENEALRLFYVAVSRAKKYLNVLSFEPYASVKPVEYISRLGEYLNQ